MQWGGVEQRRGPVRTDAPDRPRRAGAEGAALSGPPRTSLGAEPCRAGELRLPGREPRGTCPASTGCVRGTSPLLPPVAAPGALAAGRGMEPRGVGKLCGECGWSRAGAQP